MKPNNIIPVKCTETSFYRAWIEFLTPYHKLTARERDVAARILMQYFRFKESVQDPEVVRDLLWSKKSRNDIKASLQMSDAHFKMILGKLRTSGFIKDGNIDGQYIPHKVPGENRFMLAVVYDWSTPQNPIHRESE